jgi:hypothetical protein
MSGTVAAGATVSAGFKKGAFGPESLLVDLIATREMVLATCRKVWIV